MKTLNTMASCCLVLLLTSVAARAEDTTATPVTFHIEPLSMKRALTQFGRQTGLQIMFSKEAVEALSSKGVVGEYTPEAALKQLIADSGLQYEFVNARTVAIHALRPLQSDAKPTAATSLDGEMRIAQADASSAESAGQSSAESSNNTDAQQQAGDVELEEILVTAQKRIERLQDVPVPVSAINAETLTATNQLRVEDYYSKIPGVSLRAGGNGGEPVIIIRGLSTGGDGSNPTVGTVVDEVSYGGSAIIGPNIITTADIDPGDLARVEVLRGPQGTLYGASSMGGLLKYVTIDPSTERLSGRVQVGSTSVRHGNDVGYSVRGSVNVPLSDTFAVRASAFTLQDPGYVDNSETGQKDVNDRTSDGGRLAALWRPSENFSLKLSALIQNTERGGSADVDTLQGVENFQQSFLRGSGTYSRDVEAYSATMVGKLGPVEVTSATGYSIDDQFDSLDLTAVWQQIPVPNFVVDRAITLTRQKVKKFSQEIRGSMPIGERLNWLVGVFYTDERTSIFADNQAADSTGATSASLAFNSYDPGKFEETAIFTNLTVDVTDRLDIQFGGRYSENELEQQIIFGGLFFETDEPLFGDKSKAEDSAFTYLVTPRFKISPNLMAYARFASGYRPGGGNVACIFDVAIPCKFEADTTRNYEIGMKGNTQGNMLSYDISLYHIDWKDIQVPLSFAALPATVNTSRAKSQGVELSLESRPLAGLTVAGWVAYNVAELTEDFPSGALFGQSGDRLPNSSRISANVSLDREFPLWGTASGSAGGSFSYVGKRSGSFLPPFPNLVRQIFPSYTQLDLHAAMHYDPWDLNLFVNNVADKRGVLRGGLDAALFPNYFTYIQPRTIGLSLSRAF